MQTGLLVIAQTQMSQWLQVAASQISMALGMVWYSETEMFQGGQPDPGHVNDP